MQQPASLIFLAACLLLPILWGSVFGWLQESVSQLHTEKEGGWLSGGWVLFLAGFALLAVFVRACGWQWHRLYVTGILYGGLLTILAAVCWALSAYRRYVRKQLATVMSGEYAAQWCACGISFLMIGFSYLRRGFVLELYHTLPEEVTYVLATGMMGESDLSAFYASLAALAGLRTENLLFQIMPFVWLCVTLGAVLRLARHFFERAWERALLLLTFAFVVLCGSGAHMNVPYAILHAPYEGDALMGTLVVLYLFDASLCLLERGSGWIGPVLRIGLGLACAYLFVGPVQGLVLGIGQILLFLTAAVVLRPGIRKRQV